jgi:hypothetical protein
VSIARWNPKGLRRLKTQHLALSQVVVCKIRRPPLFAVTLTLHPDQCPNEPWPL